MNAREVFPFQANYDEVVSEAYDGRYDEVDIDGAKAKLAEAGVETPFTVRLDTHSPTHAVTLSSNSSKSPATRLDSTFRMLPDQTSSPRPSPTVTTM